MFDTFENMKKILASIILFFFTLFSLLPLRVHYFLSDIICFFLRRVIKYRLVEISSNISRSFPELNYVGINKLVKEYYHHMSDIIAETIWAYTASTNQISKHFELRNCELINEVYGAGRNVVVVLGHQGNWELFTGLPNINRYGFKMKNDNFVFVYKAMQSPVADMVLSKIRGKHKSCTLVESKNILRHMLKKADNNNIYFFIADQYPGKNGKIIADFLNQKTIMFNGPESIAKKLSLPVLYFNVDKVARGKYLGTFTKICDNAADVENEYVTKMFAELLSKGINNNRSSWLWSHKRWKFRIC